jgi:prepilin-type N-terminal cleavage/methylation domain-containing protein
MKNRSAFTLIEMIAVIVIIGIIVAVGIPAMSGLTRAAGLQGGVRQLSNAAQLARQLAITHRTTAVLQFTPTTFSVYTNGNSPMNYVGKVDNLPVGIIVDFANSPTLTASTVNSGSITFTPTGALSINLDQSIVLREGQTNALSLGSLVATNSNCSTVTVSAVLGRVSYQ